MRSLWVAAVEQGERAFTEQREAMEAELSSIQVERDVATASREAAMADGQQLVQQVAQLGEQLAELQQRLDRQSIVEGKSVSVRLYLGGRRIIIKTKQETICSRIL